MVVEIGRDNTGIIPDMFLNSGTPTRPRASIPLLFWLSLLLSRAQRPATLDSRRMSPNLWISRISRILRENHEIWCFERSQTTPIPVTMSETKCAVFLFPKKKTFFHEKYFFCTLHYSTALPESSSIMKIINFLKSQDFH